MPMHTGMEVTVKGGTFPNGRKGIVRYCDQWGAVIEVSGKGSFYLQKQVAANPAGHAICINYGGYYLYDQEGRLL